MRIAHQSRGEGPPLVLLAGQANNHRWWDDVRVDFHAAARSTITLDYRGTGASDEPEGPYSTREFARDVIAVLDDLGIDRAGRLRHVDGRPGGPVGGGGSPGPRPSPGPRLHHARRPPRRRHGPRPCAVPWPYGIPPRPAGPFSNLMYTPAWSASHPGPYRTLGDPDMSARARGRHLVASREHDAWDALPGITAPTLVLHGTDDVFNPAANAPLLAERIPGAGLRMIPGARHAYFDEFRAVAGPLVLDFLDG
ncbi:alpha/beta hydrolase [Streptomyces thioluteus]|uniref:Alpha/beta hydrolase n=1 Tax=Streptomyces thioluteus TaxID=66431 RepID=A0ABN3WKF4_STRTU